MNKLHDEQTISLDELLKNIHPHNKAMEKGRAILEYISQGDHRQSEAYAAAIYFFAGGEPDIAVAVLDYGVQENKKNYGRGLAGEMPPNERTEKVIKALQKNRKKIPSIIREVYQQIDAHAERYASEMSLDKFELKQYRIVLILEDSFLHQASEHRIKQTEAESIVGYLTLFPNTIRRLELGDD